MSNPDRSDPLYGPIGNDDPGVAAQRDALNRYEQEQYGQTGVASGLTQGERQTYVPNGNGFGGQTAIIQGVPFAGGTASKGKYTPAMRYVDPRNYVFGGVDHQAYLDARQNGADQANAAAAYVAQRGQINPQAVTGSLGSQQNVGGWMQRNADYLDQVQRGTAGPSAAQAQFVSARDQNIAALLAASQSGSYDPGRQALAMRGAEGQFRGTAQDSAVLRAQEQQAAMNMYSSQLGAMGQNQASITQGQQGLYSSFADQQRANDQAALAWSGEARANQDAMAQAYAQQLQGSMGYEDRWAGTVNNANASAIGKVANEQAQNNAETSMIGAGIGAVASWLGA